MGGNYSIKWDDVRGISRKQQYYDGLQQSIVYTMFLAAASLINSYIN